MVFNIYIHVDSNICFFVCLFLLLLLELWEPILIIWAHTRYKRRDECLRKGFLKGNWGKYHGERCNFSTNYPTGHSCWILNCFYHAYSSSRSLHAVSS